MKIDIGDLLVLQNTIEILEKIDYLERVITKSPGRAFETAEETIDVIKKELHIEETVSGLNNILRKGVWEMVYQGGIEKKIEDFYGLKLEKVSETYTDQYKLLIKIFGKLIPDIKNILNNELDYVTSESPPVEKDE